MRWGLPETGNPQGQSKTPGSSAQAPSAFSSWRTRLSGPPGSCRVTGPSTALLDGGPGLGVGTGELLTQHRLGAHSWGLQPWWAGLLTDVSRGDAKGLDRQSLLPRLGDAVQNPALERGCVKRLTYVYFFRLVGGSYYKKNIEASLVDPVAKTLCSQCRGPRIDPRSRN